jgi:hypothetical protein
LGKAAENNVTITAAKQSKGNIRKKIPLFFLGV